MKNRVLLKSALLLLLIAADGLVTASEDDDLIFDPEGKQTAAQAPLIETHQDDSLFHRIKRGVWDFFTSPSTTTTTTTQAPSDQKEEDEDPNQDIDKSVILNVGDKGNLTLDQPEAPSAEAGIGGIERLTLEKNEDNSVADDEHENEISNAAESQRIPITYGNSDDEDLAGSGELEGSAGDYHPDTGNQHRNTDGKARFYRITLIVGEPYRREYSDRNSLEYRELSSNLTHAIENLYNRHIPGYNHFASIVKISPTTDAFTSQVTLDIGSTFTDELEVRAILEQQLQYHSLGSIQVGPEGFTFRIFQAGKKDAQPECDQNAELRCRSGECVPLESRCDGIMQCDDGSDEDNCPIDSLNRTRDFEYTTLAPQHPSLHIPETTNTKLQPEVKPEVSDIDDREDEENEASTLRPSSNKCRADDTVRCHDGSRYICSVQQCDGVPDCDDGGDEVDCPHPGCSAGEFACDVNRCILESQRCNFVEDCQDGSDEHDCNYPDCSSTEFICRNGQCIDSSKYCDGVQDCHDGSDEHNCPCREDQFECAPGYCVPLTRRCDGYTDCVGGRDEQNCYNMTRCRADEFECASGLCVSKNARCDGRNDCPDHSDEYNCNVTTCSGDQFRCLDGICLSIDKRCNGIADCRNGEDESQCGCGEAEFRCTDGRCISYVLQCNGVNECSDGSDERDCEKYPWRNFYNAGKFAIARKSPAAISYGGKLAGRRRNMNMQTVTTESTYRLTIKPAVTIGNPILEAFPEEVQRGRFPSSMLQSPSAYLTKIAPKSKDNNSFSQWCTYVGIGPPRKPGANCSSDAQNYRLTVDQALSQLRNESQIPKPVKLSDNLVRSLQIYKHNNISLNSARSQSVNSRDRTRKIINVSNSDRTPKKSNASNSNATIIHLLFNSKEDRYATEEYIFKLKSSNINNTFFKKEVEYQNNDKIDGIETKLERNIFNRNNIDNNAKAMHHSKNATLGAAKNIYANEENSTKNNLLVTQEELTNAVTQQTDKLVCKYITNKHMICRQNDSTVTEVSIKPIYMTTSRIMTVTNETNINKNSSMTDIRGKSKIVGKNPRRRHGSHYRKYHDKYLRRIIASRKLITSTMKASTESAVDARTSTMLRNTSLKNPNVLFNKTYERRNLDSKQNDSTAAKVLIKPIYMTTYKIMTVTNETNINKNSSVTDIRGKSKIVGKNPHRRHGSHYLKYHDKYLRKIIASGKLITSTMKASTESAVVARTSTMLRNTSLKNSNVLFNKTYERRNLDSKQNSFGYNVRKESKVAKYYNKHLKHTRRVAPSKRTAPVTTDANKIEEYTMTSIKYDRTQKAASSVSEEMSSTAETNKNDYSPIKTEELLYEFNSPKVERRYFPINDDVNIMSNLSTSNHNATQQNRCNEKCSKTHKQSNVSFEKCYGNNKKTAAQNNNNIDSGLINSDETPESVTADDCTYMTSRESQESKETLESPKDDFDVLILNSTTTRAPEIVTRDANESREEASTERHGKREHKSRNGRKNNRPKKGKKNHKAKRKRKPTSTVAWKVDELTSVDYGNAYSSERTKATQLSHNDSGYDKADDNRNTSIGRNDWVLTDEITTEPFKTEFSNADESVLEDPTESSIRNGPQEETTNVDLVTSSTISHLSPASNEKGSEKCKKIDKESTNCEEDITSTTDDSIEKGTSDYGTSVSDGSSTYDTISKSGSTTLSWEFSNEENKESNEEISTIHSTIKDEENNDKSGTTGETILDEESDEINEVPQSWDEESFTHTMIGGTTHDVNSNLDSEEEKDGTEKSISDEDNEIDNGAVAITEDYENDHCNDTQHACDKYICIEEDRVCDGTVDCLNANDETDCDYIYIKRWEENQRVNKHVGLIPSTTVEGTTLDGCSRYEHLCDGTCINALDVCDGKEDCLDGTDEENCTEGIPYVKKILSCEIELTSRYSLFRPRCKTLLASNGNVT